MGKKGKRGTDGAAVKTGKGNKVEEEVNPENQPEKELGEKNLDDFLNDWDDDESDGDDEGGDSEGEDSDVGEEEEEGENEEEKEEESKPAKNKSKTGAKDQKNYISKLKEKDPEFFEFLQENDQELLNFDESSDDEDDEAEKKETWTLAPATTIILTPSSALLTGMSAGALFLKDCSTARQSMQLLLPCQYKMRGFLPW